MRSDRVSLNLLGALVAASALLVAASGALAASRGLAASPVAISPGPGTPDASPTTQISILGVAPDQLRSVRVDGSVSGLHRGAFHAYSGRRGASFVPSRPLAGASTSRCVVRFAGRSPIGRSRSRSRAWRQSRPCSTFPSSSRPSSTTSSRARGCCRRASPCARRLDAAATSSSRRCPRRWSIRRATTRSTDQPGGPGRSDDHRRSRPARVVPAARRRPMSPPTSGSSASTADRVLTWWQGKVTAAAFGLGEGVIADTSLPHGEGRACRQRLRRRPARVPRSTPAGDALFTVYSLVMVHLPGTTPGALSPLLDSIVQEVDVRTGLVVWEWHALGHIPLADSYATAGDTAPTSTPTTSTRSSRCRGDRLLVSARDTSAIYEIDRATGRIVWTLGGKAEQLPACGAGPASSSSTTPVMLPGQPGQPVRRRGGPADQGAVLPRSDPRARPAPPHGQRRAPVPPAGPARSPTARAASRRCPDGNRFVGFGSTAVLLGVLARAAAAVRRQPARSTTAATACSRFPGAPRRRRGRRSPRERNRRRAWRSTRAGTAPRPWPAGRCWPGRAPAR